jgi:hypothetical protein
MQLVYRSTPRASDGDGGVRAPWAGAGDDGARAAAAGAAARDEWHASGHAHFPAQPHGAACFFVDSSSSMPPRRSVDYVDYYTQRAYTKLSP